MGERPFRFGLQASGAESPDEWAELARQAEGLGFDTLVVPDHAVPGAFAPMVALQASADATTSLRLGTLVLNNDFHHPGLLAREAATLQLLSGGRVELGLGAGHAAPEYEALGLPFDPAPVRVGRLEESTAPACGRATTERSSSAGTGTAVLRLAAREADIVGFTGLGRTLADGQRHTVEWSDARIDAKVEVVRSAAGDRLDRLELNVLVQHVKITEHRRPVIEAIAGLLEADPSDLAGTPFLLVGTVDEIVEQLHLARERWGFSYFVTRDAAATAPVIDAMRAEKEGGGAS